MKFLFMAFLIFLPIDGYTETIHDPYIDFRSVTENDHNSAEDWPVMPSDYDSDKPYPKMNGPSHVGLYGPDDVPHKEGYCFDVHTSKKIDGIDKNVVFNSCDNYSY